MRTSIRAFHAHRFTGESAGTHHSFQGASTMAAKKKAAKKATKKAAKKK
jgi:hypothetical protein